MRYPGRVTMCVSSQAGCGMNCPFCATGQAGLTRNMSAGEIVDQVVAGARMLRDGEIAGGPEPRGSPTSCSWAWARRWRTTRSAVQAVRTLVAPQPDGLGLSARNLTMSTVGLVPAMRKFAAEGLPVTLAVSLHAPDDELRDTLVPINTRWKVAEVLDEARHYFEVTGRRVSIEYALIRDINDHGLAGRPAGHRAQPARPRLGARQPDPAQPHPGLEVDGQRPARSSAPSSSGCGRTASPPPCGTPAAGRSTAPAASWLR